MSFRLVFDDGKTFKQIMEVLEGLISECIFVIEKDKLWVKAMDLSHICLVYLELKNDDFSIYEFEGSESVEIGLNMQDVVKLMKRIKKDESVELSVDLKERKLIFQFKHENAKKNKKYSLQMVDIEGEQIDMQSLLDMEEGMQTKITLPIAELEDARADAEIFAATLQIAVKNDSLILSTQGNIGDMETVIESEELEKFESSEDMTSIYANSFLKNIFKVNVLASITNLSLGIEQPIMLRVNFLEKSSFFFCLAPRVEDDDDSQYEA